MTITLGCSLQVVLNDSPGLLNQGEMNDRI